MLIGLIVQQRIHQDQQERHRGREGRDREQQRHRRIVPERDRREGLQQQPRVDRHAHAIDDRQPADTAMEPLHQPGGADDERFVDQVADHRHLMRKLGLAHIGQRVEHAPDHHPDDELGAPGDPGIRLDEEDEGVEHVEHRALVQQVPEQHQRTERQQHHARPRAPDHQIAIGLEIHVGQKGHGQRRRAETAEVEIDGEPPGPHVLGRIGHVDVHRSAPPADIVDVVDIGPGADMRHQRPCRAARHHLGHRIIGVVEIAEHPRGTDAGLDTGRLASLLDQMIAEGTLVHAGAGAPIVRTVELASLAHVAPRDRNARMIGTGHGAGAAAHAQILIDEDDAVGLLLGRAGRTDGHAGRVVTVIAQPREETPLHVRADADLLVVHIGAPLVLVPDRGLVLHRAGGHAGVAADAGVEVDDHCIVSHGSESSFRPG